MRQQFLQPGDGVVRDAREHIAAPGKRLYAAPFARGDKAPQHCRGFAALVATEERPVASAQRDIAVGPLGGAVVDLQLAVFQKGPAPIRSRGVSTRPKLPPGKRIRRATERLPRWFWSRCRAVNSRGAPKRLPPGITRSPAPSALRCAWTPCWIGCCAIVAPVSKR